MMTELFLMEIQNGWRDTEETHLASLKRSEVKVLDHCLSQLLETVATV